MQFLKATLLCLLAIASLPLLYLALPYWLTDGELSLPTLISFILLFALSAPLCVYFAYWRYDYLVSRMPVISKNQSKLDRVFSLAAQYVILGGYLYAASRTGTDFNMSLLYLGVVIFAVGLLMVGWVMVANPYSSTIVAKYEGHQIISSGPYGLVRHPMYLGAAITLSGWVMMFQDPIFAICAVTTVLIFVIRVPFEERFLDDNLEAYAAYKQKVRYRIFPFIW